MKIPKRKKISYQVYAGFNNNIKYCPEKILLIVQHHFKLRPEDFYRKTRKRNIIKPRQVAIYLLDHYSNHKLTLRELARLTGYTEKGSHATALHHLKRVKDNLEIYQDWEDLIIEIKMKCDRYINASKMNDIRYTTIKDIF